MAVLARGARQIRVSSWGIILLYSAACVTLLLLTPVANAAAARVAAAPVLRVSAGDMVNNLAWTKPALRPGVRLASYHIWRGATRKGPFSRIGVISSRSRSYSDRVSTPRPYFYLVKAVATTGRAVSASRVVENSFVKMKARIPVTGMTLRSANGDITLELAAGAFASPTVIAVTEVPVAPTVPRGAIRVAPYFRFDPDGTQLLVPAKATIRYKIPVAHFQVAATLERYVNMVTFNPATGNWETALTTIDSSADTFTGLMSHFSYWTGDVLQPHGTQGGTVNVCTVCHNLQRTPTDYRAMDPHEKQICYNCHGNTSAALPPAGTNGPNIQAEFTDEPDQSFNPSTMSRHPVTDGGLACGDCHNQHKDPAHYYKLLRAKDAVTGRWVEPSKDTSSVGNAFCWACHGTQANAAIEASVPGYYSRTGGDRKGYLQGTPHETGISAPTASGIKCLACHKDHASASTTSLVATSVAGHTVTGNNNTLCFACHESATGIYKGEAGYTAAVHGGALCRYCHDPHGSAVTGSYVKGYEAYCYICHIQGVVQNDAISGAALADDIQEAFGKASPHSLGATFTAQGSDRILRCTSCHSVHIATGKYRQADQAKTPVSRLATPTALWGVSAGEKMNDYAGAGVYQKPNGDPFSGATLPDYVTYCTDCHNSINVIYSPTLGRNLRQLDWSAERHGRGAAIGKPTITELLAPYADGSMGSYVLSCTDCHEAHGSSNNYLLRTISNGTTVTVTGYGTPPNEIRSLCTKCHQMISSVHHALGWPSCIACHPRMGVYEQCTNCHSHGMSF